MMSQSRICICLLTVCVLAVPAAVLADLSAASPEEPKIPPARTLEEGLEQRIALDLRNIEVGDVLKFLAQKGGINIVAGMGVEGRVTLFLKDISIKNALSIIMASCNLAYETRPGDVLYVMTESEYKTAHGREFRDMRIAEMIELEYANPKSVFQALEIMKTKVGEIIVDEDSGTMFIIDTPASVERLKRAAMRLDQPQQTRVFPIQYASADDVAAALTKRLEGKRTGTITTDARNNRVIVTALPERMNEVEKLIYALDEKTKQVLLEIKILKIVLRDGFDMGVDWNLVVRQMRIPDLRFRGDFGVPTAVGNPFTLTFSHSEPRYSYAAMVEMLQEFGETKNLSSPSIAVIDGESALIHVGKTEAYVTTTVAADTMVATTAAQVTFMDVGVRLAVTPIINDLGFVTINLAPEVSSVTDYLTYSIAAGVDNVVPIVSKTLAESTVVVEDGTTIVIGGLRKDESMRQMFKVPLLGDIPLLGAAFRRVSDRTEKTEIVVFVTPTIISGDEGVVDEIKEPETKGFRG